MDVLTPRDIEKLKAIGYTIQGAPWPNERGDTTHREFQARLNGGTWIHLVVSSYAHSEEACWAKCKTHAQSPEGLKATMADKVRWLTAPNQGPATDYCEVAIGCNIGGIIQASLRGYGGEAPTYGEATGDSPEAAVDALFWKVP